jgi:hypothetical protein
MEWKLRCYSGYMRNAWAMGRHVGLFAQQLGTCLVAVIDGMA